MRKNHSKIVCIKLVHLPYLTSEIFFHSSTMHLDIIKVFYLPTDAQENCFKRILM